MKDRLLKLALGGYFVSLAAYAFLSYAFVEPNLVLSSSETYWNFQQWMWQLYSRRVELTTFYLLIICLLFFFYFLSIRRIKTTKLQLSPRNTLLLILAVSIPLLLSYNSLSYDVFNYIFNARIVVVYGQNPHVTNALQFVEDPWVRFMHNIHTSAPYGYGWTILSIIPYLLGVGKFLSTWLVFRGFMVLGLVAAVAAVRFLYKQIYEKEVPSWLFLLLFLNPLLLIESVSNMHNDFWMMAPAVAGLAYLVRYIKTKPRNIKALILGLFLLSLSIAVKLVTVVLVPLAVLLVGLRAAHYIWDKSTFIAKMQTLIIKYLPVLATLLLAMPYLTERSQRFLPWYLLWVLIFLPLIKQKIVREILIAFSASQLLRYLPWMLENGYSERIIMQQQLITWCLPAILLVAFQLLKRITKAVSLAKP
jgi:hypothetical protein